MTIRNFYYLMTGQVDKIQFDDKDVCRCGTILPSVKPDQSPFEFCSQACKDYFRDR